MRAHAMPDRDIVLIEAAARRAQAECVRSMLLRALRLLLDAPSRMRAYPRSAHVQGRAVQR
jgi:hypothetical protein